MNKNDTLNIIRQHRLVTRTEEGAFESKRHRVCTCGLPLPFPKVKAKGAHDLHLADVIAEEAHVDGRGSD